MGEREGPAGVMLIGAGRTRNRCYTRETDMAVLTVMKDLLKRGCALEEAAK